MRARLRAAEAARDRAQVENIVLSAVVYAMHGETLGRPHDVRLDRLPPNRRRLVEDVILARKEREHLDREVSRLSEALATAQAMIAADNRSRLRQVAG